MLQPTSVTHHRPIRRGRADPVAPSFQFARLALAKRRRARPEASPALRPCALISSAVSFSIRAFAPRRPKATACGFFRMGVVYNERAPRWRGKLLRLVGDSETMASVNCLHYFRRSFL